VAFKLCTAVINAARANVDPGCGRRVRRLTRLGPRLASHRTRRPAARVRLVQTRAGGGGMLDAFSRALGHPDRPPDVISLARDHRPPGEVRLDDQPGEPHCLRRRGKILAEIGAPGSGSRSAHR
jgi:hypothetical protein